MASSENQGFIRHESAAFDADRAVDAGLYHDLCDSLAHLVDESTQVIVNFPYRGSTPLDTGPPSSTTAWHPIAVLALYLASPLRGRAESPAPFFARLRVRLVAASSGGHACDFRLVAAPFGRSAEWAMLPSLGAWRNAVEGSTSSTTPVELTLTSDLILLDDVPLYVGTVATFDDVSGAVPVTVPATLVELSVWGKTANTGSTPQVWSAYAAEYVGL